MLLYKPTFFILKKKLTNFTSGLTKYFKNVKTQNLRHFKKIQFINNKGGNWGNVIRTRFNTNSLRLRNLLMNQWILKKHLKLKLFARSSLYVGNTFKFSLQKDSTTTPSFYWRKNYLNQNNSLLNSDFQSLIFFETFTNPLNDFVKSTGYRLLSSRFTLPYTWYSVVFTLSQISHLHSLPLSSITQFTKHFYSNHFFVQRNTKPFNLFRVNHNSMLVATTNENNYTNCLQESSINSFSSHPKRKLLRVLKMRTRYLPHINLVRLFRYSNNKKPISYYVDRKTFFKTPLIRLTIDYKYYKLNTLQNKKHVLTRHNSYSNFLNSFSSDNLIEHGMYFNEARGDALPFYPRSFCLSTPLDKAPSPSRNNSKGTNFSTLSSLVLFSTDFINFKFLLSNPLFYKYFFWFTNPTSSVNQLCNTPLNSLTTHTFSSRINVFRMTNLWPSPFLNFTIKRKILKIFSFNKFLPNVTMWYYNLLIRFMESCTGKKVFLKFNPFIENFLSFADIARCNMWSIRINSFQRLLGPKIFLNESLRIMHIALRFKDPTFFSNWIKGMLHRMSFWKYRLLFRYIKFAMRYLFWLYFNELDFKGLKIKLKGKISVAGNARTRTLVYRIGETGYSKIENRVICDSSIINTFTGVLGFKIWFFF